MSRYFSYVLALALCTSPAYAQTLIFDDIPSTTIAASPTPVAAPVQIATAPVVTSPVVPAAAPVNPAYIKGLTNTLIEFPNQAQSILSYYVEVDTTKIDFVKFNEIVARGSYDEIYKEVHTLASNRAAFNQGTFTDVSYYQSAPAPVAVEPIPQIVQPQPEIAAASTETTTATTTVTETTAAAAGTGSFAGLTTVGFYAGLGVLGGGLVAAGVSGGGGSNEGVDFNNPSTDPNVQDVFGRNSLPYLVTPASLIDTEMNAYDQNALERENAHFAHARGLTGLGVTIGFHDFFENDLSGDNELNSRIVDDTNTNYPVEDLICQNDPTECGHGQAVMRAAAAERDGNGTFGVAYEASLMMSSVYGADSSRYLADNGADIVNYSCGGGNCDDYSDLQYITGLGVLITAATGNDGGADPNPISPARFASLLDYQLIAVTGAYDIGGGALSNAAYDKCGNQQDYCMTALSNNGTSFAAPQVAGAAALIKQGWSFLTAKEIGQILLVSATDIGVAGVDPVYGHGLLNLKAASEPIGSLSVLNGYGLSNFSPSSIVQNQNTAFGNAFSTKDNAKGNVTVVDSFGRDFKVKTQDNLRVSRMPTLTDKSFQAFGQKKQDLTSMKMGSKLTLQFSQAPNSGDKRDFAGFAEYDADAHAKIRMGFSSSMNNVEDRSMQKFNKTSFISPEVFGNGFLNFSNNNQVYYQGVELATAKNVKTKFTSIHSRNNFVEELGMVQNEVTADYTSSMMETTYSASDALDLNFKSGMTYEDNSILGTKFTGAFDLADGAATYFSGMDASYDVRPDVNVYASYTLGMTKASPSAASSFNNVSDLVSDSFSVTATKKELMGHDSLSLSIGQPTRVLSGKASGLTQQVDRSTGDVSAVAFEQSLVPTGRTMLFQAAYEKELSDDIDMNFAVEYADQPYHQKDEDGETTALVKFVYRLN